MKVADFDFELPEDRIALAPKSPRESARLLCVVPGSVLADRSIADRSIADLPALLRPDDVLVFNDTRVIHAELKGLRHRNEHRANLSVTLLERCSENRWQALARPFKRLKTGDRVVFRRPRLDNRLFLLTARIAAKGESGQIELAFDLDGAALDKAIENVGFMPLPAYISTRRQTSGEDETNYQTIYARNDGAIAAPTAGLHFTTDLLAALDARGIERHFVTLHVGAGTFLPVKADDTKDHIMHTERGCLDADTAAALNQARTQGRRIVAVGTTSLRLLESAAAVEKGQGAAAFAAWQGDTNIFITPGYRFRAVDVLLTNFHLPRSTLFMLVAAFSGLDEMRRAYDHAIKTHYRFYSYGDACLLERAENAGATSL